ncbi:hypothetical protein NL676_031929 [Syzygium grande]|nr:hypothetical protein NL676_031929 [Syzygium grande]
MMSGNILMKSKYFDKKRDLEGVNSAARSLRKEARSWFNDTESGSASGCVNVYAKASAWYHVTYHPNYWGRYKEEAREDHFLSFPWIGFESLVKHSAYYPVRMAKLFILKYMPRFFVSVWKISRFFEKATLEKIVIVSNEGEREDLIKEIRGEVLPEEYGGKQSLCPCRMLFCPL